MLSQLRTAIGSFASDETGAVRPKSGPALAWATGVLVGASVMLGAPGKADADGVCAYWETGCRTHAECAGKNCFDGGPFCFDGPYCNAELGFCFCL